MRSRHRRLQRDVMTSTGWNPQDGSGPYLLYTEQKNVNNFAIFIICTIFAP